jgi:hypothetical protein
MNYCTAMLIFAGLTACQPAPAHASDARPPGWQAISPVGQSYKLPPGDNLGYEPAPSLVTDWPMDPPMPVPAAGPTLLESWRGAPAGWSPPGLDGPGLGGGAGGGGRPDTNGDGRGGSCERSPNRPPFCRPHPDPVDPPGVPGPLPVLGLAAAYVYSRKLRRRIIR